MGGDILERLENIKRPSQVKKYQKQVEAATLLELSSTEEDIGLSDKL